MSSKTMSTTPSDISMEHLDPEDLGESEAVHLPAPSYQLDAI